MGKPRGAPGKPRFPAAGKQKITRRRWTEDEDMELIRLSEKCVTARGTVDFAAVLEEYEHPTPARISQKNQRRRFSEFSNETLAVMATLGVHGASKERMLREIMRVDGCSYVEAYAVLAR